MRKCWIISTPKKNRVFSSLTYACEVFPDLAKHKAAMYKTPMNIRRSFGKAGDFISVEHVELLIK
jgi:hypothetical protein